MADGMNLAIVIGNLCADPELRFTQNGKAVLNFRIACSESWVSDGQKQERTEYMTCVLWGKRAEGLSKVLHKGDRVCVKASIQTRKWNDKQGNDRYSTELNVNDVVLCGGGGKRAQRQESSADDGWGGDGGGGFGNDEIPF